MTTTLPFAEAQQDRVRSKITFVRPKRSFDLEVSVFEFLPDEQVQDAFKRSAN